MSNGRFLRIKKSTLLRSALLLFFFSFLTYIFVSIFVIRNSSLWFFGFCIFIGLFELVKSFLFRFDSSFYFGSLLLLVGIFGHIFILTNLTVYSPFFITLAFLLASISTFIFCGQKFHLIIAFSIFFVSIYTLLLTKNIINVSVFLAFVLPFLLLLIIEVIWTCFLKK